ncbi:MAG: MFS transporter [Chloroflexi bacterium HGW-Chloroflexi-4]|jgi:MFS family permease|nr:MAG: MFS transporter [Chloroflexi bacterium HGW-Chloroflexi-4]
MIDQTFKSYRYRWVVLAVFMFVNLMMQLLWISYAPVTGPSAKFYGVTDQGIGFLAMAFMIVYIPLSIPESWAIDTFGFRKMVSLGAILMGVFGLLRGFAGANYNLAMLCTIGIAIGQPFLMNSWTTVPAKWFEQEFRATAVGLVTLAGLIGVALGMVLTPILNQSLPIDQIQVIYGGIAALSALLFVILARETPPTPPCPDGMQTRALMLDGLKNALSNRKFWLILLVAFLGMAIFNGLTTWVESIVRPRGFSPEEAGTLGAVMLVGGIVGAIILPAFSDKEHKRQKYLIIGLLCAIPGLVGFTFAHSLWLLIASSFALGFFLVSTSPITMQFGAEITQPTPEGTSNGLFQLFGQTSVVFVYIMEAMKDKSGGFTPSLVLSIVLLILCVLVSLRLKDPDFSALPAEIPSEIEAPVSGVAS